MRTIQPSEFRLEDWAINPRKEERPAHVSQDREDLRIQASNIVYLAEYRRRKRCPLPPR